jgi:hypothetical protein
VTEVYVDVAAATLGAGSAAPNPETIRALRYLADAGVRVLLVRSGATEEPAPELLDLATEVLTAMPRRPRGPAWYLTSDIARCLGSSARLKTVLIGGAPPSGSVRRCDAVARDVQAAAMEILAAEAMSPGRTGAA